MRDTGCICIVKTCCCPSSWFHELLLFLLARLPDLSWAETSQILPQSYSVNSTVTVSVRTMKDIMIFDCLHIQGLFCYSHNKRNIPSSQYSKSYRYRSQDLCHPLRRYIEWAWPRYWMGSFSNLCPLKIGFLQYVDSFSRLVILATVRRTVSKFYQQSYSDNLNNLVPHSRSSHHQRHLQLSQ